MVKDKLKSNPVIIASFFCAVLVYSGLFSIPEKDAFNSVCPENSIRTLEGTVCSSPSKCSSGKYYQCFFEADFAEGEKISGSVTGKVRLFIPSEIVESLFPGKLYSESRQKEFIENGSLVTVTGSFRQGMFFSETVRNKGFGPGLLNRIKYVRALARLQFKRMMYSWGPSGGLLLALLSGSREYTEPDLSDGFRDAGLSHILALSGMHLSMFSGIAVFLGTRIGRKRLTQALQLVSVIIFVWFAGLSPSLLRAFICNSVLLFQGVINVKKSDMLEVLCFSFVCQAMLSPNDLTNSGFLLSYGALLGILILGGFFRKLYGYLIPQKIAQNLSVSTGAQCFTAPVSLSLFGKLVPGGIISSLFVSPLVTLFIYSGLLMILICMAFPVLVPLGDFFMGIQYTLIRNMVSVFARIPAIQIN